MTILLTAFTALGFAGCLTVAFLMLLAFWLGFTMASIMAMNALTEAQEHIQALQLRADEQHAALVNCTESLETWKSIATK